MAWGATLATPAIADNVDRTSYSTASWTPTASRLIKVDVAFSVSSGTAVAPTLSGNGITWVKIAENIAGSAQGLATYVGLSGASPSAGALTADFAGVTQTHGDIHVLEIDGAYISSTAAAAVVQSNSGAGSSVTSLSYTLNSAPLAASRCFSAFCIFVNEAITPRASWTEMADAGHASPARRLESQWRSDASEQTVSASWTTSTFARAVALEIADVAVAAVLAAALGTLTAAISATPDHPATLAAPLGGLTSAISATPDHPATFASALGSLAAAITAGVDHPASFAAPLGQLTAAVSAGVSHDAAFSAPLGSLVAQLAATVTHDAVFAANLGQLVAAISAAPEHAAMFAADLGSLLASVTAGVQHPATFTADLGALVAVMVATARSKMFNGPTRPNIAYQYPRGESAAARAFSRHLPVTREGINVYILTDDTVTTERPDDSTRLRRVLWGGHEEPVNNDETALLVGAGYGSYIE